MAVIRLGRVPGVVEFHQAEEYFAFLPNDLDFTFLSNDKGVRQAVAPDKIISSDDSALALASRTLAGFRSR